MSTFPKTICEESTLINNVDPNIPSLHLRAIGFGEICQNVLAKFRTQYESQVRINFDGLDTEILQCDELSFIVVDLNDVRDNQFGEIAEILGKPTRGLNILITICENTGTISQDEKSKIRQLNALKMIDAHCPMISTYTNDVEIIGKNIFDRIRSIEKLLTMDNFAVSFGEFKTTLIDERFGQCATEFAYTQLMHGEGRGENKAMYAVARALAHSSHIELSQADSIILLIKTNGANHKVRDYKLIYRAVRSQVSEQCCFHTSFCYDNDLSSDTLEVELWATKLSTETKMLQMTSAIAGEMKAKRYQSS